jgi:hypothetical protein
MVLALLAAAVQSTQFHVEPQALSPERRAAVVLVSLVFFVAIAFYSGRKLRRALSRRPKEPQAPSFWN